MDSILTSIKKNLGVDENNEHFDPDLITYINGVLMSLMQIGIGPSEGFEIIDKHDLWSDFIPEDFQQFSAVKSFMTIKVKLLFDPPLSSTVIESMNNMANEYEWRLREAVETFKQSQ
jgi:hypothetical protein